VTAVLEPLPYMGEVDITETSFEAALAKTGQFAAAHNLAMLGDPIALSVGHVHFGVGAHEGLLVVIDEASGIFTTQVVPRNELIGCQEIAWRFDGNGERFATIWLAHGQRVEAPTAESLALLGSFLAREGLVNTLTVQALPIRIGAGQVLREHTNRRSRIQMTVVGVLQPGENRLAATWQFGTDGTPLIAGICFTADHDEDVNDDGTTKK
jgi:hypothetical protein